MKNGLPEIRDLKNFRCQIGSDPFWKFESFGEWDGIEYDGVGNSEEDACESLLFNISRKLMEEYHAEAREEYRKELERQDIKPLERL